MFPIPKHITLALMLLIFRCLSFSVPQECTTHRARTLSVLATATPSTLRTVLAQADIRWTHWVRGWGWSFSIYWAWCYVLATHNADPSKTAMDLSVLWETINKGTRKHLHSVTNASKDINKLWQRTAERQFWWGWLEQKGKCRTWIQRGRWEPDHVREC